MTDTPVTRLRERHRRCSCWGENCGGVRPNVDANSHCAKCIVTWPCDTIAALDALDALLVVSPADLEAFALSTQSIIRHAEGKDTEIRALQARIDAATVLIREVDTLLRVLDTRMCGTRLSHFCDFSEPRMRVRAWLAGDKEETSE